MCTFTTFSHFIIYFHNPLTSEGKRIKKRGLKTEPGSKES